MPATDPTMTQLIRMIEAGWEVKFYPSVLGESSGITAQKPGELVIWVDDDGWQDDIPAAWERLVAAWKRQVGKDADEVGV